MDLNKRPRKEDTGHRGSKPEVITRIAQTIAVLTKLRIIWSDRNITLKSKIRLMRSLVFSIYPICLRIMDLNKRPRKEDTDHRDEMLSQTPRHLSYKDHLTNEEVRKQIQQSIGPFDDLLTTVKNCKLKWYGHVVRSKGLAKTILQGTVQGQRVRGRQRKRWEDNI